jgi:Tfp pilus assembly protein PilF
MTSCSNPEKEKLRHLARGQEYLKEKRYAEARIEFRAALQIDKKMAGAHFGLGEAALALGFVPEAAESYYEAIRLDPNNLEARTRIGNLLVQYANDESLKEAERLANDVLQKSPQSIDGHVLLANIRIAQKQWDEAKEELQRSIDLDPERVETQLSLARYYDQRAKADPKQASGLLAQAEAVFLKLIEKNPNAAGVRLAFGDFLFAHKRDANAEQQLLKAFAADPKDKLVLVALRRYYESQQRRGRKVSRQPRRTRSGQGCRTRADH